VKVEEMIVKCLKDNDFDGLVNTENECGCCFDDFIPCDNLSSKCEGANKYGEGENFYMLKGY